MELKTAPYFFPSLQIYKGTSPVCSETKTDTALKTTYKSVVANVSGVLSVA